MSENNKSARKKYIKKKSRRLVATEALNSPKSSNNGKIRPIRKISQTSRENSSRNKLFLRQQRQHVLRTRRKPLTAEQKKEVKKAMKSIMTFEKAPFMLVYSFGIASLILSLYSQLTSMLTSSVTLMTNLLSAIPYIGWAAWGFLKAADLGVQAIGFGLSLLVGLLQLCISMYVSYFMWRYSTFMQRFLVRRLMWVIIPLVSLIPLVNLIPWTALGVFSLHQVLKRRSKKAYKTLKKYRIKF